ncbi:MAG: hypothetical protein KGZ30_01690 [Anaplasmataceae bacterium]|nr:hypothetical protein [Anaplasmataceae bacterium]
MKKIVWAILVLVLVALIIWAGLYFLDWRTLKEVEAITDYLKDFYITNNRYPSVQDFSSKFDGAALPFSKDPKYLYSYDDLQPHLFTLQYSMNLKNSSAPGERKVSEFTGTTYAYQLTSCHIGGECYGWEK